MAYIPICWPEIQHYMELPGFDENAYLINDDHGIDDFGSSAYFVDEDWLNDIESDGDEGPDRKFVEDIVDYACDTFENEQDFEFKEPLRLSNGMTATGFYIDDKIWNVKVVTKSDNGMQVDVLLENFVPLEEAKELARRISFGEYTCVGVTLQDEADKGSFVNDVVSRSLHVFEDGEEYEFEEPILLSENRIAKKFWVDDGNEDIRVEIWQTYPNEAWREDAFLSSMDVVDAYKVAESIDNDEYRICVDDELDRSEVEVPWSYGKHFD